MTVTIRPKKLMGEIDAISSKSAAHRTLIAAALANEPTKIYTNALSDDIMATLQCLRAFGCEIQEKGNVISVSPFNSTNHSPNLDCIESGSTARFLLPVAAALFESFTMTGCGRLPLRPFAPLCSELVRHGCKISSDTLPMTVCGKLRRGDFYIPGDISSQFISGLLLSLPLLEVDSRIILTTPLQSSAYVDMTLATLCDFSVSIEKTEYGFFISGGQIYKSPQEATIEGDWSNSAFFLCMNALGCDITVKGLNDLSAQGDKSVMQILDSLKISGGDVRIDLTQIPDLGPVLAVVSALRIGRTEIYGGERLKAKESDRLNTTYTMLKALGADIEVTNDGFIINGVSSLGGGVVDGCGDHRIVMAAATAAVACKNPVTILGAEAVNKSYPLFFEHYKALGGDADVIYDR